MIFSTAIFNMLARTLATILYTPPTKLIGRNSLNVNGPWFLHNKRNEGSIEALFKRTSSVKFMEDIHDVYFKHLSASLEKTQNKTIKA